MLKNRWTGFPPVFLQYAGSSCTSEREILEFSSFLYGIIFFKSSGILGMSSSSEVMKKGVRDILEQVHI